MGKDIGQPRPAIKPTNQRPAAWEATGPCVSEAIDQGGEGADRLLRRNARKRFIARSRSLRFDTAQKSLILPFVTGTILM